jgi:hypothetical protein
VVYSVSGILKGGPAEEGGLREGEDFIVGSERMPINSEEALVEVFSRPQDRLAAQGESKEGIADGDDHSISVASGTGIGDSSTSLVSDSHDANNDVVLLYVYNSRTDTMRTVALQASRVRLQLPTPSGVSASNPLNTSFESYSSFELGGQAGADEPTTEAPAPSTTAAAVSKSGGPAAPASVVDAEHATDATSQSTAPAPSEGDGEGGVDAAGNPTAPSEEGTKAEGRSLRKSLAGLLKRPVREKEGESATKKPSAANPAAEAAADASDAAPPEGPKAPTPTKPSRFSMANISKRFSVASPSREDGNDHSDVPKPPARPSRVGSALSSVSSVIQDMTGSPSWKAAQNKLNAVAMLAGRASITGNRQMASMWLEYYGMRVDPITAMPNGGGTGRTLPLDDEDLETAEMRARKDRLGAGDLFARLTGVPASALMAIASGSVEEESTPTPPKPTAESESEEETDKVRELKPRSRKTRGELKRASEESARAKARAMGVANPEDKTWDIASKKTAPEAEDKIVMYSAAKKDKASKLAL